MQALSELKNALMQAEADLSVDAAASVLAAAAASADPDVVRWLDGSDDDSIFSWAWSSCNVVTLMWLSDRFDIILDPDEATSFAVMRDSSRALQWLHDTGRLGSIPEDLINRAVICWRWESLVWLSEHGFPTAHLLNWWGILHGGINVVLWAKRLGFRYTWDWDCVRAIFSNGSALQEWAFEDPSFVEFVNRSDLSFSSFITILENFVGGFCFRRAAQRFPPVVLPVALRAAARKNPDTFKRIVRSGALLREHCLASGGALLHAVHRKRSRLSLLKRTFALTRSDFASAGLSAAFSNDL
jgi:hypothetical protein